MEDEPLFMATDFSYIALNGYAYKNVSLVTLCKCYSHWGEFCEKMRAAFWAARYIYLYKSSVTLSLWKRAYPVLCLLSHKLPADELRFQSPYPSSASQVISAL